jgi:4-amino-4-deoxy-L-arabinose transferase-like glycosyltransferase
MLEATLTEPAGLVGPRSPVATHTASRRAHWALLLGVTIVGLLLRLYEFRGFGAVDDAAYAQIAHQMAQGTFHAGTYEGPAVFPLRVGMIYPTAILFRFFGVSEWTMVAFPFILSLLSILLAYAATKHFFGARAGLIAAAIWTLLPLDAFHAGILEPDLAGAFFQSLGILGIVVAIERHRSRLQSSLLVGLGLGALFGISWLCKESVAYAAPFCAFLMFRTLRTDWKRHAPLWAGVAVGSIAVLVLEMAVYHGATGDWLFHFHETERNYHQYQNAFFVSGSSLTSPNQHSYAAAVVRRLVLDGPATIFLRSQFMHLPLLAAIVCLHALYWRDRAYLIPALWFASLAFMFNFASSSLSSYTPLILFERYLYPVMLPAAILVAGFLATLFFDVAPQRNPGVRRERAFWGGLLVAGLFLVAVEKNYANRKFSPGWVSETKALSRSLRPADRVYTDILSIHGLEFFWGYPHGMNLVNFEDMDVRSPMRAGDYVLVNATYVNWLTNMAGWWPTERATYTKPAFADRPPTTWETVWKSGNATLYRVR